MASSDGELFCWRWPHHIKLAVRRDLCSKTSFQVDSAITNGPGVGIAYLAYDCKEKEEEQGI